MDENLKAVDEKIAAILKEHNCTLTVKHVITINEIPKPVTKKKGKNK